MKQCSVEARGLEVRAGGRVLVRAESLRLGPGLHALIGPNGAGKTSLLRALAGIVSYRGEVKVCGDRSPAEARELLGYMPAYPEVDLLARAGNVIEAGTYGASASDGEILWAARLAGVEALLDRRFITLSGGERRLVCLARVLARRPRILLLDEPLSFLDLKNVASVIGLLRSIARAGRVVVVAGHELQYLSAFDTVTLVSRGKTVYTGAPEDIPLSLLERVYETRLVEARVGGFRVILPGEIFGSIAGANDGDLQQGG